MPEERSEGDLALVVFGSPLPERRRYAPGSGLLFLRSIGLLTFVLLGCRFLPVEESPAG